MCRLLEIDDLTIQRLTDKRLMFHRAAGERDRPHGGRVREAGPVLQRLLGIQGETGELHAR